jgi:HEAT repeat protein
MEGEFMSSQSDLQKINELADTLKNSTNISSKISAISALGKINNDIAYELLLDALKDTNSDVREAAFRALDLDGENSRLASEEIKALIIIGEINRLLTEKETEKDKKQELEVRFENILNALKSYQSSNISNLLIGRVGQGKTLGNKVRHSHEYGKLELSDEFIDLLGKLSQDANSSESDIVKKGLVFVGLASKVKEQGFRLAVVDTDGSIISEIDGF